VSLLNITTNLEPSYDEGTPVTFTVSGLIGIANGTTVYWAVGIVYPSGSGGTIATGNFNSGDYTSAIVQDESISISTNIPMVYRNEKMGLSIVTDSHNIGTSRIVYDIALCNIIDVNNSCTVEVSDLTPGKSDILEYAITCLDSPSGSIYFVLESSYWSFSCFSLVTDSSTTRIWDNQIVVYEEFPGTINVKLKWVSNEYKSSQQLYDTPLQFKIVSSTGLILGYTPPVSYHADSSVQILSEMSARTEFTKIGFSIYAKVNISNIASFIESEGSSIEGTPGLLFELELKPYSKVPMDPTSASFDNLSLTNMTKVNKNLARHFATSDGLVTFLIALSDLTGIDSNNFFTLSLKTKLKKNSETRLVLKSDTFYISPTAFNQNNFAVVTGSISDINFFDAIGDSISASASVSNYTAFEDSQISSVPGIPGLLTELVLESNSAISFYNFSIESFTRITGKLCQLFRISDGAHTSAITLNNLSGLSRENAPYDFTISLLTKPSRTSEARDVIASHQYTLTADAFPAPPPVDPPVDALSVTGSFSDIVFDQVHDAVRASFTVTNYETFVREQVSSSAGVDGLLIELTANPNQVANLDNFDVSSLTRITNRSYFTRILSDGTYSANLMLDNLTGLIRSGAPYALSLSLWAKLTRTSETRTLLSTQQYLITADAFPPEYNYPNMALLPATFNLNASYPELTAISFTVSGLTGLADGTTLYWYVGRVSPIGNAWIRPSTNGTAVVSGESINISTTVPAVGQPGWTMGISIYTDASTASEFMIVQRYNISYILDVSNTATISVNNVNPSGDAELEITVTCLDVPEERIYLTTEGVVPITDFVVVDNEFSTTRIVTTLEFVSFPGTRTKTIRYQRPWNVSAASLAGKTFRFRAVGAIYGHSLGHSPTLTFATPAAMAATASIGDATFTKLGDSVSITISATDVIVNDPAIFYMTLESADGVSFANFDTLPNFTSNGYYELRASLSTSGTKTSTLNLKTVSLLQAAKAPFEFTLKMFLRGSNGASDSILSTKSFSIAASALPGPLEIVTSLPGKDFLSKGDALAFSIGVTNYETFYKENVQTTAMGANKYSGLKFELIMESSQFYDKNGDRKGISFNNFSMNVFRKVATAASELLITSDGTVSESMALNNLNHLSKLDAPYVITLSLYAYVSWATNDRALLAFHQYEISPLAFPPDMSISGNIADAVFTNPGDAITTQFVVANYDSFVVDQVSSIEGTPGLLSEIHLESLQNISLDNFSITSFNKMSPQIATKNILSNGEIVSTLSFSNANGLSRAAAPYTFKILLKAKLEKAVEDRTILAEKQFTIPATFFPRPLVISLVPSITTLEYKVPLTLTVGSTYLAENLTFENKAQKYVAIYCMGSLVTMEDLIISDGTKANVVASSIPGDNGAPLIINADADGYKCIVVKLTAAEPSKTITVTLDKLIPNSTSLNLVFVMEEVSLTYSRIPANSSYDTISSVYVGPLGQSSNLTLKIPFINYLENYYENSSGLITISNLNYFEGQTIHWKLNLRKSTAFYKTLATGSATVVSGFISTNTPIPYVYADSYYLEFFINGSDDFNTPLIPNLLRIHEPLLQVADDTVLTTDKTTLEHGDLITLTLTSTALNLTQLRLATGALEYISPSKFFRVRDGVETELSEDLLVDYVSGSTTTIQIRVKPLARSITGKSFTFMLLTIADDVVGVPDGEVVVQTTGMVIPPPPPLEFTLNLTAPVAGHLKLYDDFTLSMTVQNLLKNNLMSDALTTPVILAFTAISFNTYFTLKTVTPVSDTRWSGDLLVVELLPTSESVEFTFTFSKMDKVTYFKLPKTAVMKVRKSFNDDTVIASSNEVSLDRFPPPTSRNLKTFIFNRNKNNTFAPFLENKIRQDPVWFARYNVDRTDVTAKILNNTKHPDASEELRPLISDQALKAQTRFNINRNNEIDNASFAFKKYSPYLMLNLTSMTALEGNYIIAIDSDYTSQNNLIFDTMTKASTYNHTPDYRCLYLKNTHPSDSAIQVGIYIADQPSAKDVLEVGLDPSGKDGVAASVANVYAAPAGVTFTKATYDEPLIVGVLAPGQSIAFWIKRYSTSETEAPAVIDVSRIAYKALV